MWNSGVFTIENSNIKSSGATTSDGVYNTGGSAGTIELIENSIITGITNSIRNETNFTTRVGSSKLAGGGVLPNGGTVTCAGVHDENYTFFASTCP